MSGSVVMCVCSEDDKNTDDVGGTIKNSINVVQLMCRKSS
jgi:hypothetical protein